MTNYHYLFPFEKVPASSRILIYGAGDLGQDYLFQMQLTHYCEVVAMVDRNFEKYPPMVVPVISPWEIREWVFDYVVVALRVAIAFNEISRILEEQGVPQDKIVCIFERSNEDVRIFKEGQAAENRLPLSCEENSVAIAILLTGGLGDHVIQKRLLVEIMALVPGVPIDLYAIRHVGFLKYLYSDCTAICHVIDDLGSQYNAKRNKYAFSMSVEACHYLRVDEYKKELFQNVYLDFVNRIEILQGEIAREKVDLNTPVHVSNLIRLYKGLNAYSGFSYNGAFLIDSKDVRFPLTEKGESFFRNLGILQYYTVNYGNGDCRDGGKVAKMWPLDRFERTIALLKMRYPYLAAVQLGVADAPKMKGADRHIFGETMENVGSVLKHAFFHLDIEGGLVHIASQIGTKCVVLFGPTVKEYYGYEKNINIRAGGCHNCWGLYSDVNRCVREMEEPECMYSITPELVVESISEYVESIDNEENK